MSDDHSEYDDWRPALRPMHAPSRASTATHFIPYKYVLLESGDGFKVHARSACGRERRIFTMSIKSWSYIELRDCADADAPRAVQMLKEEISTDIVAYHPEFGAFSVAPSNAITRCVRDISRRIVRVELTTYSLLSRYGKRFFNPFTSEGLWQDEDELAGGGEGANPAAVAASHTEAARGVLRAVVWSAVDSKTVAFVATAPAATGIPAVHVWTTYASFAHAPHAGAAAAAVLAGAPRAPARGEDDDDASDSDEEPPPTLDICVRVFGSEAEMVAEIAEMLVSETDVAVHYNEDDISATATSALCAPGPLALALKRVRASRDEALEIFDLRDYVENVYTDMPTHSFRAVVAEVSVAALDARGRARSPADAVAAGALAALGIVGGGAAAQNAVEAAHSDAYLPDLRTTMHSAENVVYFLEKIAARAFLMARLFCVLSKSIFDLVHLSGCNMATLTQREHTSRGVVSFVDGMAAWSQIVDALPHDYMSAGAHSRTFVTPFASLLIEALRDSGDDLTARVGRHVAPLRAYGWIVREIFCLRALRPLPPPDLPAAFGIFRGMVYSTEPIEGHEHDRQWSSVMQVGLGSWIGVTLEEPRGGDAGGSSPRFPGADARGADGAGSAIAFGYFGIEDVCRHPFDAVKAAVEMFLSLRICSNTAALPKTVAASTTLTSENMAIRRRVTAANIEVYRKLIPPPDAAAIAAGEKSIVLKLWYRENATTYTTNPIVANRRIYVAILEDILTRAFGGLLPPAPPAAAAAHHFDVLPLPAESARGGERAAPAPASDETARHQRAHERHHNARAPPRAEPPATPVVTQILAPVDTVFRSFGHPHARKPAPQ